MNILGNINSNIPKIEITNTFPSYIRDRDRFYGCYVYEIDKIYIKPTKPFFNYILLHELAHSTAHPDRVGRRVFDRDVNRVNSGIDNCLIFEYNALQSSFEYTPASNSDVYLQPKVDLPYATEELIAELVAKGVSDRLGLLAPKWVNDSIKLYREHVELTPKLDNHIEDCINFLCKVE